MSRNKKRKGAARFARQFELSRRQISGGAVRLSDMKQLEKGHESRRMADGVTTFLPRDPRRKSSRGPLRAAPIKNL